MPRQKAGCKILDCPRPCRRPVTNTVDFWSKAVTVPITFDVPVPQRRVSASSFAVHIPLTAVQFSICNSQECAVYLAVHSLTARRSVSQPNVNCKAVLNDNPSFYQRMTCCTDNRVVRLIILRLVCETCEYS
jgi:hypothetical protein